MPQETSEGIVLRAVDFSETSRIVTFLTPVRGRLACMVKGARRKGSAWAGLLDTFNRLDLVYYWKDGREVQTLAEAALLDGYAALKEDVERSAFASFPLEVAYKTAHENEPAAAFYGALARGLEALCMWEGEARAHALWQVLQLLGAAGFAPELDACVRCGGVLPAAPGFAFDGGAVCAGCASERRLSAEGFAALRALCGAQARCPAARVPKEVETVVRRYASVQLDTAFRSVRVLEEMFG